MGHLSISHAVSQTELLASLFPIKNRPIFSEGELVHLPRTDKGAESTSSPPETLLQMIGRYMVQWPKGFQTKTDLDTCQPLSRSGASRPKTILPRSARTVPRIRLINHADRQGDLNMMPYPESPEYPSKFPGVQTGIPRDEVMHQVVKEAQRQKPLMTTQAVHQMMDTPVSRSIEVDRTQRLLERNKFLSNSINHLVNGYFQTQG